MIARMVALLRAVPSTLARFGYWGGVVMRAATSRATAFLRR